MKRLAALCAVAAQISGCAGLEQGKPDIVRTPLPEIYAVTQRDWHREQPEFTAISYADGRWTSLAARSMSGESGAKDRYLDYLIEGVPPAAAGAAGTANLVTISVGAGMKDRYLGVRVHCEGGCIELKWDDESSLTVIPPDECTTRMNS